ncbi:MAG: tRNA 2-selenouridine(34) synthase MnmH [Desulfuromonadaceae bacterium]
MKRGTSLLNPHVQIEIEKAVTHLDKGSIFIDVRAPSEFAQATIPGAYNIPILTEEQRIEVGTIHQQQGAARARMRGMEIISPCLPGVINQIRELHQQHKRPIIVFCWRGGLRSTAMTSFLHLCGLPVFQLRGGHKAFRHHVLEYFAHARWARMLVLRGLTGVGKTRILEQLKREGWPVLNLEALANHRGSAFGAIGCAQQPSQKQFEALLWNELRHTDAQDFILTEGESRHIGRVMLPKRLHASMQEETTLWLETDMVNRIRVIAEDYDVENLPAQAFTHAVNALVPRLGHARVDQLHQLLELRDWDTLIEKLMLQYYDPLYAHTKPETRIDIEVDPFAEEHPDLLHTIKALTGKDPLLPE